MKVLALHLPTTSQKQLNAILDGTTGIPPVEMSAEAIKLNTENIVEASKLSIEGVKFEANQGLGVYNGPYTGEENARVAVISIVGPMAKHTHIDWSSWSLVRGTRTVIQDIAKAEADTKVKSILFYVDSGGGTVDGTYELGKAIAMTKKPTTAVISGICASACYWVTSQCDNIYATSPTAFVGSIGTLMVHYDESLYLQSQGVKITHVTATKSINKILAPSTEPLTDEKEAKLVAMMNPLNEGFIATVKTGRGDKLKDNPEIFSGKLFNAKEGKKLGLIDGIKLFEDVIREVTKAASKFEKENRSAASNTSKSKSEKMGILQILGFTEKDIVTEEETLSPKEINTILANVKSLTDQNASATDELETVKAELLTAKTSFEEVKETGAEASIAMQAEIDALKAEKAELELRPTTEALETLNAEHVTAIETLTAEHTKLEANYNLLAKKAGVQVINKSENQGDPDSGVRVDVTSKKNNW